MIEEEVEAERHEIAHMQSIVEMHINRARNFYPDQDGLTTMAFPTVPVLLPIIELSKNNQIPSRQSMAFT